MIEYCSAIFLLFCQKCLWSYRVNHEQFRGTQALLCSVSSDKWPPKLTWNVLRLKLASVRMMLNEAAAIEIVRGGMHSPENRNPFMPANEYRCFTLHGRQNLGGWRKIYQKLKLFYLPTGTIVAYSNEMVPNRSVDLTTFRNLVDAESVWIEEIWQNVSFSFSVK